MGLGRLVHDEPTRDAALAADTATEYVLCMLGLPPDDARGLCQRSLPDIGGLSWPGSAA